jgi:hypothetical protein
VVRGGVAATAVRALAAPPCVDDHIPPRPAVSVAPPDADPGGDDADAGEAADADGGVPPPPTDGGVTLLASASPCGGMNLVVSAGTLYWTEEVTGTVKSVRTTGGPTTTIASSQMSPGAIAVDAAWVYWVAGNHKIVMRRPVAGGNSTVFVHATTQEEKFGGENDINALLAARNMLFFGRYTDANAIPADGSVPKVIGESPMSDLGQPGAFALDATHLYQTEILHNAVSRELLDGTQNGLLEDGVTRQPFAPDRIAVSQGGLLTDAIAVVDDDVFWADGAALKSKVVDALDTSATVVTTSVGGNSITGFVISGDTLYFGEGASDTVETASIASGVATVMVTGQPSPGQFAADDQNVYWRTSDCRIMKLAK